MRATLDDRLRGGRTARALLMGGLVGGLAVLEAACGASAVGSRASGPTRRVGEGRPSLTVIERDGDPSGAIAVAVTTAGIAPERGATVGVSLGALVEARLAARALGGAVPIGALPSVVGGWDGWRLRAFATTPGDGAALIEAVRDAMIAPVTSNDSALADVARKVGALARRPVADPALVEATQCTGEAYGVGAEAAPSASELEAWRRAAHGLGRVAIATTGPASLTDAVASALLRAPAWPSAAAIAPSPWPTEDAPAIVYDASGTLSPGAARVVVTARTGAPERAVATAEILGDARGPLASRLAALDGRARVRSVVAAAHAYGGCVATTMDLAARDLLSDAPARIATAATLALQEVAGEAEEVSAPPDLGRQLAMRASDPREAAERAAWWSLARPRSANETVRAALTVGVAAKRSAALPGTVAATAPSSTADAVRVELDRANAAWHSRVVEARTRVERGQGETWVLLASTCGTLPESARDAGVGAVVALAGAAQAERDAGDARIEPFVAPDGIGLLAHGPARPGESPGAHARRLSDAAARAFAADSLDGDRIAQARAALLARAGSVEEQSLTVLGGALAPGHPSWFRPTGTPLGVASISNDAVMSRAVAMREEPLRVAVLADTDDVQAETAVRSVDRWIARRPGRTRTCAPRPILGGIAASTYAVDLPPGDTPSAWLALPLADGEATRTEAIWMAAALAGADGWLAESLGTPSAAAPDTPLARAWDSAVVGGPGHRALAVRVVASDASLDAAVARTRAVLERLRQGDVREADRTRAASSVARAVAAAALDPRERAIELWRGDTAGPPPSLDALRAFAAATLRDEALVVVVARSPRVDTADRATPRDPSSKAKP